MKRPIRNLRWYIAGLVFLSTVINYVDRQKSQRAMRITRIEAFAIKIPRDLSDARGTAGSPAPLAESRNEYRWAANYQTLYSTKIETALIKVTTDSGLTGWGEAQSPVAPESKSCGRLMKTSSRYEAQRQNRAGAGRGVWLFFGSQQLTFGRRWFHSSTFRPAKPALKKPSHSPIPLHCIIPIAMIDWPSFRSTSPQVLMKGFYVVL